MRAGSASMSSHRTRRRGSRSLIRHAISFDSTPSRSKSWASGCPSGRELIRISRSDLAARTDPEPTVLDPDEDGRCAVPTGLIDALTSRCGERKRLRARLGEGTSSGSSRQQVRTESRESPHRPGVSQGGGARPTRSLDPIAWGEWERSTHPFSVRLGGGPWNAAGRRAAIAGLGAAISGLWTSRQPR
jgi:hypothetical protein